ncbi:MAG: START domain-containing protein [Bacteroidota bacterium]
MAITHKLRFHFIHLFVLTWVLSGSLAAQSWNFIREQDGIKIYTRQEAGKSLRAFKGTAIINAPAEKVFTLIEDVNHTAWWDKNLTQIKVLAYEKNKRARYYLVYDTPWPVANRDLCVEVTVSMDPEKRIYAVVAASLTGVIPEQKNLVRIKDYRQTWTVSSAGENSSNVVLEGYLDPVGHIPVWISNMLIIQTPFNSILGVRQQMLN